MRLTHTSRRRYGTTRITVTAIVVGAVWMSMCGCRGADPSARRFGDGSRARVAAIPQADAATVENPTHSQTCTSQRLRPAPSESASSAAVVAVAAEPDALATPPTQPVIEAAPLRPYLEPQWLARAEPAPIAASRPQAGVAAPADADIEETQATPASERADDADGRADEWVSINFEQVDIRTVIKTIGQITGINFVVDENVQGTVTMLSPTQVRLDEVYGVLEAILGVHGYAAVPGAGLTKIVPKTEAPKHNLRVRIGSDPADIPETDEVVTQIMPLRYADAAQIRQIVEPLASDGSQMSVYPRTNSVVISDTSANIHHIARIVQQLDVQGAEEKTTVITLQYASAQVLSEQISRIMQTTQAGAVTPTRAQTVTQASTTTKILPDSRTNSLIIVANERDTATIRDLAKQLDVQRPSETKNVHVVYLQNADANAVAASLTTALVNLRITGALEAGDQVHVSADGSTNSVIIDAPPQDYEVVAQIIEKLDIVREQVLVEMLILEVSEEALTEIGVDWATMDEAIAGSVRGFGLTNLGPRVSFLTGQLEGLAVGAWRGGGSDVQIGAILQALEKISGVNIQSMPHILTLNHQKARIVAGDNRAFVMQSRVTETTDFITPTVIKTFEYRDVGITLEITPHISQSQRLRLEINSEFTKLIEDVATPSADTPTTSKRLAETVVSMDSGATVVIGGLMRDDKVNVVTKVPLLGDIPIIGEAFRSRKERLTKTNLLLFITPHIVTDQTQMDRITESKNEQMPPEGRLPQK